MMEPGAAEEPPLTRRAASLGPYQFQVLAWTGAQYTSYAAAVGQPNTDTGRSAVFSENTCYINMLPLLNQGWLGNMPAIVLQPQLPGDSNGDGRVDVNDLTIVLSHFGQTATASEPATPFGRARAQYVALFAVALLGLAAAGGVAS